jgi:hypothetical protein
MIAEETGLSKSAVQTALDTLRYRELIITACCGTSGAQKIGTI